MKKRIQYHESNHFNLGQQQFHVATTNNNGDSGGDDDEVIAQRVMGSIWTNCSKLRTDT